MGVRDDDVKGVGWYVEVIKNWRRGDGEWPDWLRKRLQIEGYTAQLAGRAAEIARESTPVVSSATAEAEIAEAQAATDAELDALPDQERETLLDQAVSEVLAGMKPMNPMKMFVKRDGHKHPMVRHQAKHLLVLYRESQLAQERAHRGFDAAVVDSGATTAGPPASSAASPEGNREGNSADVPNGTARSP